MALRAIPANESQANVEASLANAICEEGMRFHPPNTAHDASGCGVRHTHREARGIQLADKKDYPGGLGGAYDARRSAAIFGVRDLLLRRRR